MNEQRQQAYLDLIERLLNCPSEEEAEILQANLDLLDAEFLLMLEAAAEQQGDENTANWLRNLANQLREALNLSSPTSANTSQEELQAYWQFLMTVLQATAESNRDVLVVYPLLENNTQYLNVNLAELLRRWATNKLAEVETDIAQSIAGVIFNFSNLIQQFSLGDKASNMEIAIAGYEVALTVFTKDAFPQEWATLQNSLGNVYCHRIFGEEAQNIKLAIAYYTNALSVITKDASPQEWARGQNNLGAVYCDRIFDEKAENIELAIAYFTNALEVYTKDAFPQDWAQTQFNLGNAYGERIFGKKAQNIELAIAYYTNALQVRTKDAFPQDWADTQLNLGNAYGERIEGEKAQNIELAITSYTNALSVRTKEAFPQEWATVQNNLGAAYFKRINGEKAQNIELAIASHTNALSVRTKDAFPQDWAQTQYNLGAVYYNKIFGEKAQNIELAIASFTKASEVYTKDAFPQDWADTQLHLGIAYRERIKGEKTQNIELAITSFFTNALEVYTKDAFPQDWADTQNNLGNAYYQRIEGKKAQNIEVAITYYTNALEVYTKDAFPQDWAQTQYNLGNAYFYRIEGKKAENIELAIASLTKASEAYTKDAFPEDWADTQYNLGTAYCERIKADKAQNIELAIAYFTNALEVYTKDAFPERWADIQNNLGNPYRKRIFGDKAQNIELAIASFTKASEVYTKDAFPGDWAMTQNNLGIAYCQIIKGKKPQNTELGIRYFTKALEVYTKDAFPKDWPWTQWNLGNAYCERINGDKAQNIELGITYFTNALEVYTKDAFPEQWASMQSNLGNAYCQRINDDKAQNIELAMAFCSAALEVRTKDVFPENHAETLYILGVTYQKAQHFSDAYTTFKSAIETAELLRGEIVSGDESKRKQAEQWNSLYRRMVEVCLKLGNITEAIEYVERSKTRNLVELILERDLNIIFPPEVVTELEQLRDEIASGQNQLQNHKAENPTALAQHLQQLREKRKELQDNYLPIGYGFRFDQFQATLDDQTAVIEWYITDAGFETFIITRDSLQRLNISNQDEENAWINWVNGYFNAYDQTTKTEWINSLASRLSRLGEILHLEDILKLVPETCSRLVLIPHTLLHLFPLHALPLTNGDFLCDIFPDGVSYAPSCQLLQQVQLRQRPDFQSLFAIQNPIEELYQDYEWDVGAVAAIKKQFANSEILKEVNAKKSEVLRSEKLHAANCMFFFCHGYFNSDSPLDSGLELADGNLTLAEIIADFKLDNCRLVTLSACETGLIDYLNTSDEYIGLPYGFLLAGSTNVVSSLWTVEPTATALLMIRFFEELQQQSNIAVALNTAQRWLRNTTVQGFRDWLSNSQLSEEWQDELDRYFEQIEEKQGAATKYFESPYYWSAFCVIGKGV